MKVYATTKHSPFETREVMSIHMTRKGALQVACETMLEIMLGYDTYDDSDLVWIEDNLGTLYNPDHTLTIAELDGIFEYADRLLLEVDTEVEIMWYTLEP